MHIHNTFVYRPTSYLFQAFSKNFLILFLLAGLFWHLLFFHDFSPTDMSFKTKVPNKYNMEYFLINISKKYNKLNKSSLLYRHPDEWF
jgi:hypothetical protein